MKKSRVSTTTTIGPGKVDTELLLCLELVIVSHNAHVGMRHIADGQLRLSTDAEASDKQ